MCRVVFRGAAVHRALHSFPTRRSSDLGEVRSGLRSEWRDEKKQDEERAPHDGLLGLGLKPQARRVSRLQREDRKSTRLNSSHLVISYAVFCLKKKTAPHQTPTHGTSSQ